MIRRMYSGPLTGCREIIELAVRSPAASSGETRKITATGTNATQSKLKPYLNGTGTLTSGTSGIEAKSTVPISHATHVAEGQADDDRAQAQKRHVDTVQHNDSADHQRRQKHMAGGAQIRRTEARRRCRSSPL